MTNLSRDQTVNKDLSASGGRFVNPESFPAAVFGRFEPLQETNLTNYFWQTCLNRKHLHLPAGLTLRAAATVKHGARVSAV